MRIDPRHHEAACSLVDEWVRKARRGGAEEPSERELQAMYEDALAEVAGEVGDEEVLVPTGARGSFEDIHDRLGEDKP